MTRATVLHLETCECRKCAELRNQAKMLDVKLTGPIEYFETPVPQKKKVYKIAEPFERPDPPGDTTLRGVKSDRVKQYVKDAVKYIEQLELATAGHVSLDHCKLCGGVKAQGYICCQCGEDDSTVEFG